MARPANAPVVDRGVLKRLPGLPNTATAAILLARPGSSGGADPKLPIRCPTGGTPASIETAAAPCENPPSTSRVDGHRSTISAMWSRASLAPSAVVRKL
ncbi:hypothetical protein PICSAR136_03263 [Mycobacterium avium subsp. paratuberculosis]|nr:hypothetical protein PICSAR55_02716 [Mycobacterium avium subsp. paratuberculosis]CAG7629368.1 hypothetical protein PICSAR136_03263 [Mycobacterium avium subsp. paratuberculosis]